MNIARPLRMDHAPHLFESRPRAILNLRDTPARHSPSTWERVELREEVHPAGAQLYGASERCDRLYVVRRGRVRLMRQGPGSQLFLADLLGAGAVFGHLPWGAECPGEEAATAATEVALASIEATHWSAVCRAHPQFSQDLMAGLGASVQRDRQRVRCFASKEVPAHLAATLLRLGDEFGEPCSHGGVVDLRRIRQEDMADLIGASRSFVSTLITEMKRWGWLGSAGRVLCLRDLAALRKAAFDDE